MLSCSHLDFYPCKFAVLTITVSIVLLTSSCQTVKTSTEATRKDSGERLSINSIKFSLPSAYQWEKQNGAAEGITVFTIANVAQPFAKVIYQRLPNRIKPKMLASQVISPMRKQCQRSALSVYTTSSRYPDQINYEVLCTRLKGADFGMVSYLNLYSDRDSHHLLISETITPPSEKIGQFEVTKISKSRNFQTAILAFIRSVQKMMISASVCDKNGRCM